MQSTILLIGKNSYVGNYFERSAKAANLPIIAVSSKECDFLVRDQVVQLFESLKDTPLTVVFPAVINKSVANSYQSYTQNLAMIDNFIAASNSARIDSMIYFSSVDVYGNNPPQPINENSTVDPDTWYGLAKYCCEWMLTRSEAVNFPVTALRIPGIYGKSKSDRSVIGAICKKALSEHRITIHGAGTALRDYVYVDDLCKLIFELLPLKHHGTLNVVTGESHSIKEVASQVALAAQIEVEILHEPSDTSRDFDLVFDNSKLQTLIPKVQFTDLSSGIKNYMH